MCESVTNAFDNVPSLQFIFSHLFLMSFHVYCRHHSVDRLTNPFVSFLFLCLSVPFSSTQYLKNAFRESLQILYKRSLGLKGELIRYWWSIAKGQGHGCFTK